eukprot:scaffold33_cov135-Pinguiococcus_pyrenoidosus.AAC.4
MSTLMPKPSPFTVSEPVSVATSSAEKAASVGAAESMDPSVGCKEAAVLGADVGAPKTASVGGAESMDPSVGCEEAAVLGADVGAPTRTFSDGALVGASVEKLSQNSGSSSWWDERRGSQWSQRPSPATPSRSARDHCLAKFENRQRCSPSKACSSNSSPVRSSRGTAPCRPGTRPPWRALPRKCARTSSLSGRPHCRKRSHADLLQPCR